MYNYENSWLNGCCEDTNLFTVYNEADNIHTKLSAELYNDMILVKLNNPLLYEVPAIYYFKVHVTLYNAYNWRVDDISNAPLYSLEI